MARQDATRKAAFCLATGVAPSEYPDLTSLERETFLTLARKQ